MENPSDTLSATSHDKFVKIGLSADNSTFDSSVLARNLQILSDIYAEIAEKQTNFAASVRSKGLTVGCPADCGSCCEHFMPDVLPVEADMLAYHLLLKKPTLVNLVFVGPEATARPDGCPFWNAEGGGRNCRVYEGRPLICRLFGCSTVHSKKDEPVFAFCKRFPQDPKLLSRTYTGERQMVENFGFVPPAMSDYSAMVLGIEPDSAAERLPLDKALPPSLNRVALILQMTARPA